MTASWTDDVLLAIPSINGGKLLAVMLPTLRFPAANVVVLDQGSTDNTAAICAQYGVVLHQLGRPHTYTQACNIGADLARRQGCKYVCVSNNDIAFRTDVLRDLHAAMERDPRLGIVAPAQIVYDRAYDVPVAAYRVFWDLSKVHFQHDTDGAGPDALRLEADFCELTCALIRMSAIEDIGFLDDTYGFYHEDADFGFRLRKAGFACAYLPQSQIDHFISSTISNEKALQKADYLLRNKRVFVQKHLGFGINHGPAQLSLHGGWAAFQRSLRPVLENYALLEPSNPTLWTMGGEPDRFSYAYASAEDPRLSARQITQFKRAMAVFTTSPALQDALVGSGIRRSFHVPLGIDPDVFHPWGRAQTGQTTYLAHVHGQQRRLLAQVLRAWDQVRGGRAVRLILYGPGLTAAMAATPSRCFRAGSADILQFDALGIEVHDLVEPALPEELATLLRSADFIITSDHNDDDALAVLQAAACGVPALVVRSRPAGLFSVAGAVVLNRLPVTQPEQDDVAGLAAGLAATFALTTAERAELSQAAVIAVRGHFTLRDTAMALHRALSHLQIRAPGKFIPWLDGTAALDPAGLPVLAAPLATAVLARGRLQWAAAQRLRTAGVITARFGADWQQHGLRAAIGTLRQELRYFVQGRLPKLMRLIQPAQRLRLRLQSPAKDTAKPDRPDSTLLIGYIDANLGLGQSLRGLARALDRAGAAFGIYPFTVGVETRRGEPFLPQRYDLAHTHGVNIIEVTVDELAQVRRHLGRNYFRRSYNVLRTYWELGRAPEEWRAKLDGIDEIWAPTPFVADSLRGVFDGPITVIPPCIDPPNAPAGGRTLFELDAGRHYFLFSFDYHSFPQRKNPLGVVRAFRHAFPDPDQPVGLIIKSTGEPQHHPAIKHELRVAAQDDPRIRIVDESLSRQDMLALMAAADCYVSLHRAEGFGLGMVEVMALGKPVIATDYSGSTDFLSDQTGYPVPYPLLPLKARDYIHSAGQVWAYADEDACAVAMRRVVDDPAEAAAKASAAHAFITARYGPDHVGTLALARLNAILNRTA